MRYIFPSVVLAMVVGLIAQGVYGAENLREYKWVEMLFWAIIATGAFIAALVASRCALCRFLSTQKQRICQGTPCVET